MPNELTLLPDDAPVVVTKSQMTKLMMETYKKSASAMDEIMCLKEVAKLHGLYDNKQTNITLNIEQHVHQLEKMSDEELLRLTGATDDLLMMPDVIEAEYEEV